MDSIIYKNEIIKRKFFGYVRNSEGFSPKTINCYEQAIWRWEDFSNKSDFAYFNKTEVEKFKDWLRNKDKANSQEKVSVSYCYDVLRHLKVFFEWLSKQAGYKRKIDQTTIDYLRLPKADVRIATQLKQVEIPSLEEIKTVIESIGGDSEIEMRDKALFSLAFLTGARITAIMTLPMKSFDKEKLVIHQDPTLGVKTKFSKNITSVLIAFSYKEPLNYFLKWFDYLEKQKGFKPSDPIFPTTKIENGKENLNYYNTGEIEPIFWKSSSSPRKIFEKRFEQAGVKYYHPHTFRHSLVKRISKLPLNEEQKKAFSQNLGHEKTTTTFGFYGQRNLETDRQIEVIKNIDFEGEGHEVRYIPADSEHIKQLIREIKENKD